MNGLVVLIGYKRFLSGKLVNMDSINNKMKVEIWSDVMCPFCYIGKRKFENALGQFAHKNDIQLIWKSFQLAPDMKATGESIYHYLAKHKGVSLEDAKRMNDHVTQIAAKVGLTYHMDKAIVANSFNAHRFSHFALQHGKQNEAEEKLFFAYFTEGKNIDDFNVLIQLGADLGLDALKLRTALEKETYADDVRADVDEASQLGITGVPFFVFNRKYAISGAQDSEAFLNTLDKSFAEWRKENPVNKLEVSNGQVCKPDGNCN